MESEDNLVSEIRRCNAGAEFPNINPLSITILNDKEFTQDTIYGREEHRLKTFLAILLMHVIRDFTDTDHGVYKSHDAVPVIIGLCSKDRDLRKRLRAQFRRCLSSPSWQKDATIKRARRCIYCGVYIKNDGEGFSRREHLQETHPNTLPVERDEGMPFSNGHILVVRDHLLKCLAGLVRRDSWDNHRRFFEGDWSKEDFHRLESLILSKGNALGFFTD